MVLATELSEDLIREGLARELVRIIQDRRKEMGCEFSDRIEVSFATESVELRTAIDQFKDYILGETLALIGRHDVPRGQSVEAERPGLRSGIPHRKFEPFETTVGDHPLTLCIRVSSRRKPLS